MKSVMLVVIDEVWLENGGEGTKLPPSMVMLSTAIVAMAGLVWSRKFALDEGKPSGVMVGNVQPITDLKIVGK